jgi:hypothetical protein
MRMWTRRLGEAVLLLSLSLGSAMAQGPCGPQKPVTVGCLTLDVIDQALGVTTSPLAAGAGPVTGNAFLVVPLTAAQPTPSPASGFVYTFDPAAGVYGRASNSFGPILSERADTIGAKKIFLGWTFQRFVFDKVDGENIHSLPIPSLIGTQIGGTINTDLQLNQYTLFATYGINDRVDVSLSVPFSTVRYGVALNLSSPGPNPIPFTASGSHTASGVGDIDMELKALAWRRKNAALALGTVFRLPTGDEYEALGTGSLGVKPFVAASINYKHVSPHMNAGYLLNGKSVLAGNVLTGDRRQIPDQVQYAVGIDSGLTGWLTAAFDVLGTEVIHGDRFGVSRKSYNMTNGSAGIKINAGGTVLVVVNALFPLNNGSGLRTKIAPMVGLSYAF